MASTYVNDLRLNEMATGDQSGSWGTVTNLNLELIGEAFSYGTEAITTNADTHTTTIADGAADPGRSMFLKYTGTLDSACTITIGPNTVSKVWFIENSTTGSQNIIISQGSGANVTIAAGQTKAVYSDGAGSGAAFVDAFSSLNVAGVSPTELAILDGLTASTAELNILDGVTATTAELNYNDITTLGTVQASKTVTADASGDVTFPDNAKARFGSSNDLQIWHDGSNSYIKDHDAGNLFIQGSTTVTIEDVSGNNMAVFNDGGSVDLYHGATTRIATTSSGIDVTGTVTMDGATTSANINFGDSDKAVFGAGGDLQIYHNGSHSYIAENGQGNLTVMAGNWYLNNASDSQNMMTAINGGAVKLFHNGVEKFETTSGGINVTGTAVTDGVTVAGTTQLEEVFEKVSISAETSGTATVNTQVAGIIFFNVNQTANRTINFVSVNANLAIGQSVTCAILLTQGTTAYYLNAYQVDGSAVTPKWQGGSAPTEGNASGIDSYSFTIIKTADATFTVLASQTQFA